MMTLRELAQVGGVNYNTLLSWCYQGKLPAVRDGWRWFANEMSLRAMRAQGAHRRGCRFDWQRFERESQG